MNTIIGNKFEYSKQVSRSFLDWDVIVLEM